jgi:hypothetical protein
MLITGDYQFVLHHGLALLTACQSDEQCQRRSRP